MVQVDFTMEAVWEFVSARIRDNNTGTIDAKLGKDPDTKREALLLLNGTSPGVNPHATILLISPSLADTTKTKAMKAAMKKQTPIAFATSDVSFYSTVLVLGDDFSAATLLTLQNHGANIQPVTVNTIDSSL